MRFSPKSLLLCSVMFSVGCATTPSWMAGSKTKDTHHSEKAKLLAAAEQYERDGKTEMAEQLYARAAAQDAKEKKAIEPEPEQVVAIPTPKPKVEEVETPKSSPEPTQGLTAAELLAQFEKSRANRSVAKTAQSNSKPMPTLDASTETSPFRNVSSESFTKTDIPSAAPSAGDTPEWAKGIETSLETVENKVANHNSKEPVSDDEVPLWNLEKIDSESAIEQSQSEQLAEAPISDDSRVEQVATRSKSIDEWWDDVFVSEELAQTTEPEIATSENPFSDSQVTDELITKSEVTPPVESDLEKFQTPVRIEEVPEFETAIGGWHRTSLARLCPELKPELEPLVQRLDSISEDDKISALIELADLGEEAKSADLAVRALHQDENELVQIYAAAATRSIESDAWDSVKVLKSCLASDDPEVVHLAAYTLGKIGPEAMDATDALCELRDSHVTATSLYAAEALTRITPHDGRSFEQITKALHSDDSELRWFAAVTLGNATKLNQERAVVALAEALRDSEPNVRTAAALSLGGFGEGAQPVLNDLKHAAEFDTPEVREAARTALACLK